MTLPENTTKGVVLNKIVRVDSASLRARACAACRFNATYRYHIVRTAHTQGASGCGHGAGLGGKDDAHRSGNQLRQVLRPAVADWAVREPPNPYPICPQHACIQCADFCWPLLFGSISPFPLMIIAAFRATEWRLCVLRTTAHERRMACVWAPGEHDTLHSGWYRV